MFWVIRWVDAGEDKAVVVEAETRAAAEYAALKRNIPVVFIGEADEDDVRDARRAKRLWKYTADPKYTCLGRPVSGFHVVCFMIAGIMTAMLHVNRILQATSLLPTVHQWVA
jgi:hypothetical protein